MKIQIHQKQIFPSALAFMLALIATIAPAGITFAQPASTSSISFQAALNGTNGLPLANGNYNLTFRFWDGSAPGGNPVSTNILVANVSVSGGIASTAIPVDPSWFNGQTRYLGVMVNGGMELSPRILVAEVPYAAYSVTTRSISVVGTNDVTIGSQSAAATLTMNGRGGNPQASQGPQWAPATLSINGPSGNSDYPEDGNIWLTAGPGEGALLLGLESTNAHPHPAAFIQSHGNVPLILNPLGENVGIGTGDPGYPLTVENVSLDTDVISWRNGSGELGRLGWQGDNASGWLGLHNGSSWAVWIAANGQSYFNGGHVGIGTTDPQAALDVNGTARMTVCQITSDRNVKNGFQAVSDRDVLTKLAAMPISTWCYTNNPDIRHIGPMAQDFAKAFGVGEDDKHIATVDADGVALAAIQGLNQKLEDQLREKDSQISDLEKRLSSLEHMISSMSEAQPK